MGRGVRCRTAAALLLALVCTASPAAAQAAGEVSFQIYEGVEPIGTQTVTVVQTATGWLITGGGELGSGFKLQVRQLEMEYEADWRPKRMTMELVSPDDSAVVHVAFGLADGTTRTDIVRPGTAAWGSNTVAADTIPLPDYVFGAYEVLAARLVGATPGTELRAFVVPRFEGLMRLDSVVDETLETTSGVVPIKRWRITMQRPEGPTPLQVWVGNGRLYRLDLPAEQLSVVRMDVLERR